MLRCGSRCGSNSSGNCPWGVVLLVETGAAGRSGAMHFPVLHPEHLSSTATPLNAESMCKPQPLQVGLPQVPHGFSQHIRIARAGESTAAGSKVEVADDTTGWQRFYTHVCM